MIRDDLRQTLDLDCQPSEERGQRALSIRYRCWSETAFSNLECEKCLQLQSKGLFGNRLVEAPEKTKALCGVIHEPPLDGVQTSPGAVSGPPILIGGSFDLQNRDAPVQREQLRDRIQQAADVL